MPVPTTRQLTFLLAVMIAQGLLSAKLSAAELPPVQVICPAIEIEGTPEKSLFGYYQQYRNFQQPELVVLGTVRVLAKDGRQDGIYELDVEKVLYGTYKEKTLLFVGGYYDDSQRRIFAIAPGMQAQENLFLHRYSVDPEEEKAMRALGEARLDTNALGSECIFIGKVIEDYAQRFRIVEIVRPLSGNSPDKGQRVKVSFIGFRDEPIRAPASDAGEKPVVSHQIYFATVDRRFQSLSESPNDEKPKDEIFYRATCRQPIDRVPDVLAALKRRDDYPVADAVDEDGQLIRQREVLFRGSIEDAIEFLGAESEPAVSLGRRRLIHDWQKARPAVLAAIEKLLPQGIEQNRGDHRRLKNLIELVGSLRKEAELKQLIDRYLETVSRRPPEFPTLKFRDQELPFSWPFSKQWEEEHDDFNHGLAWLVQQLDERVVQREYGQKLLRLRDQAKGQWKQEVQLALDICRVEDRLDLDVGLAKMKEVKPVRSPTSGVRHDGHDALAFSNDGKYLATVSYELVRVWRVKDWSLVSEFPQLGSMELVRFSPDDRFLYLAGQSGAEKVPARRHPVHVRFDWRTGKLDQTYTADTFPLRGWEQSSNDPRVVSADGKRVADITSRRELTPKSDSTTSSVRSLGQPKSLAQFVIRSVPDLEKISECELILPSYPGLGSLALSPDGKTLAIATFRGAACFFDTDTGKRILPAKGHTDGIHSLYFPEGGKTVRTVGHEGDICLWDAATLELRSRIELPGSYEILSIREPDGRYLICQDMGASGEMPVIKVVDADTGKDISSLTLSKVYYRPKFHWLNESEVVFCNNIQIIRFDFRSGKVLKELVVRGESAQISSDGERTEDGSAVYSITSLGQGSVRANLLDLTTGKVRLIGHTDLPRSTGNSSGLVPGGKHFYLGGSNLYLLDRRTLQVVTEKQFRKTRSEHLTFNADGSRYAALMESDFSFSRLLSGEAELQDRIRIYETRSGKTLGAFPTSARAARPERLPGAPLDPGVPLIPGAPPILPPGKVINFSPDGQRLAIINDDDTIELWDLSSLNRGR